MSTRTVWLMLAVLTTGGASRLSAQGPRFSLGGGLTIPAGGYGTADGAGWHLLGAALVPLSLPHLALRVDAMYGRTPREGLETGRTTLAGASASVVWRLRDRKSTRLNSSHRCISDAVFCLKKKR